MTSTVNAPRLYQASADLFAEMACPGNSAKSRKDRGLIAAALKAHHCTEAVKGDADPSSIDARDLLPDTRDVDKGLRLAEKSLRKVLLCGNLALAFLLRADRPDEPPPEGYGRFTNEEVYEHFAEIERCDSRGLRRMFSSFGRHMHLAAAWAYMRHQELKACGNFLSITELMSSLEAMTELVTRARRFEPLFDRSSLKKMAGELERMPAA